jgi:thioredoxin reductase (NADPH)
MGDVLDLLIVGGGAAGFTAGIFAARDRRRALLVERLSAGGQVLNCEHIANYPGFPDGVAGYTLGPLMQEQAMKLGLEVAMGEVSGIRLDGDVKIVETDGGRHAARAVIVASGSSFVTLGVPGEDTFLGRGISHCAACDGSFFMGKPVVVVGGGDAAVDEAVHLTQYAASVTVVHRRDALRACASLAERARRDAKIAFRWNTVLRAVEGGDGVERVQLEDLATGARSTLPASGVFIYAGLRPNTEFLGGLVPLDERGQIVTDIRMRTAVPGVLAAGDVRRDSARQLVSSAGDGATAALAAIDYLRTGRWPAP